MSRSTSAKAEETGERTQLLVRVPTEHALLAKRLAARAGITLTEYIDKLIVEDVAEHAEEVRAEIERWRDDSVAAAHERASIEAEAVSRVSRSSAHRSRGG
ncbi:hypothetical protein NS183_13245 [Microbacterium testaceum]|uniref:hypothetical protein n=1 Tax=Microbacterium testaceum TaxID=2033 RepID=UPI000734CB83|nr:hypothetical protein [Microbacterium testaceum]KTS85154.1 hypothetical protein NS183_13245 [Microbacterium testaceum]